MEHEHDSAGNALRTMSQVSDGYSAPAEACISYQTLYHALADFEADLHQHIHLKTTFCFLVRLPWRKHVEWLINEYNGSRTDRRKISCLTGSYGSPLGWSCLFRSRCLAVLAIKQSATGRRYRRRSLPPMDACCSPARQFAMARTFGNQPADRKSARSGDTEPMSLLTGARIIFTGSRRSC